MSACPSDHACGCGSPDCTSAYQKVLNAAAIEGGGYFNAELLWALDDFAAKVRVKTLEEAADTAEEVGKRLHSEGEPTASNGAYDVMSELRREIASGQDPAAECNVLVDVNDAGRLNATCDRHGLLVSATDDKTERAVESIAREHLREPQTGPKPVGDHFIYCFIYDGELCSCGGNTGGRPGPALSGP